MLSLIQRNAHFLGLNFGRRYFHLSVPLFDEDQFSRLKDIILVRHGESEGNIAYRQSLAGDHRFDFFFKSYDVVPFFYYQFLFELCMFFWTLQIMEIWRLWCLSLSFIMLYIRIVCIQVNLCLGTQVVGGKFSWFLCILAL